MGPAAVSQTRSVVPGAGIVDRVFFVKLQGKGVVDSASGFVVRVPGTAPAKATVPQGTPPLPPKDPRSRQRMRLPYFPESLERGRPPFESWVFSEAAGIEERRSPSIPHARVVHALHKQDAGSWSTRQEPGLRRPSSSRPRAHTNGVC